MPATEPRQKIHYYLWMPFRNGTRFCWTTPAIALLALTFAAPPAVALPPGDSALDQYVEQVPTSTGDRDLDRSAANKKKLSRRLSEQFRGRGEVGLMTAELAAATGPTKTSTEVAGTFNGDGEVSDAPVGQPAVTDSPGTVESWRAAVGAGGGGGTNLVLIAAAILLTIGMAVVSQRARKNARGA